MTSFKEEFPNIGKYAELIAGDECSGRWKISSGSMKAHLLSKQRVREDIEEVFAIPIAKFLRMSVEEAELYAKTKWALLERLGL